MGDEIDDDILDAAAGHARFKAQFARERAFFEGLAEKAQKPRLLWIGCSDSRVVPAQITSADPGELFEVRNIANVVPPMAAPDVSVGAAIEYALGHLGIDDIVVCGHTGCGGVKAMVEAANIPETSQLGQWIDHTGPAAALIRAAGLTGAEALDEAVKAHALFQVDNLMTYPIVAEGVKAGRVKVHAWVYEMETGSILSYAAGVGWRPLAETEVAEDAGDTSFGDM